MFSQLSTPKARTIAINQPKNYNGIDLIKFVCAIMVFIIHIPPFQGQVSGLDKSVNFWLQHYLCRLAVPFYFVSSGFFLFKKMPLYDINPETIKNYCFKILRLLGIWYILLFMGETGHLWYLKATVIAVILLSLCFYSRMRFRNICLLAGVLYTIGLLGDAYYGIVEPLTNFTVFRYIFRIYEIAFRTTRNGVFMGFIFILMGAAFSHYKIKIKPITSLIGLSASVLCLFAEVFLLKRNDIPDEYNMYIFLLPATFFLFSFAYSVRLKDHAIYKHLRNIGMLVYFSHRLINKLLSLSIGPIKNFCGIDVTRHLFILTLFFTLLFAIFVEWLSCKEKFKWVNLVLS